MAMAMARGGGRVFALLATTEAVGEGRRVFLYVGYGDVGWAAGEGVRLWSVGDGGGGGGGRAHVLALSVMTEAVGAAGGFSVCDGGGGIGGGEMKRKRFFYLTDLGGNLGASDDGGEGPLGHLDGALKVVELLLEEEAGHGRREELGDALGGAVGAVGSPEGVVHEEVERRRELLSEAWGGGERE